MDKPKFLTALRTHARTIAEVAVVAALVVWLNIRLGAIEDAADTAADNADSCANEVSDLAKQVDEIKTDVDEVKDAVEAVGNDVQEVGVR